MAMNGPAGATTLATSSLEPPVACPPAVSVMVRMFPGILMSVALGSRLNTFHFLKLYTLAGAYIVIFEYIYMFIFLFLGSVSFPVSITK